MWEIVLLCRAEGCVCVCVCVCVLGVAGGGGGGGGGAMLLSPARRHVSVKRLSADLMTGKIF